MDIPRAGVALSPLKQEGKESYFPHLTQLQGRTSLCSQGVLVVHQQLS